MPGERLLLVEDDPLERQAIARPLSRAGYRVQEAGNANQGLELLGNLDYDLLLVDIRMPGMDGLDFLQRAQSQTSDPGVLIVTGYGTLENATRAMELGADGFLTKPVFPNRVLEAVRQLLETRAQALEARRLRTYQPVLDLVHLISRKDRLNRLLDSVIALLARGTGARRVALFLRLQDRLVLAGQRGFRSAVPAPPEDAAQQLEASLAKVGDTLIKKDGFFSWPELRPVTGRPATTFCIPLQVSGQVHGLVMVGRSPSSINFQTSDVRLLWILCSVMGAVVATAQQAQLLSFYRKGEIQP